MGLNSMKESVQKLGRGLALAGALSGCGSPEEVSCEETTTENIRIGTVNAVSGGVMQQVSYQLTQTPDCFEATGNDPFYVVAEADTIGVETRSSGDPLSADDTQTPGKPFSKSEFKDAARVNVGEGGWDVLSFPLDANENLAAVRLCLLSDNPGSATADNYQEKVADTIISCTKTKTIISE